MLGLGPIQSIQQASGWVVGRMTLCLGGLHPLPGGFYYSDGSQDGWFFVLVHYNWNLSLMICNLLCHQQGQLQSSYHKILQKS